jgi:Dockerin type I domain
VVHFSGKARKMNHIPLFCERSELWLSIYNSLYIDSLQFILITLQIYNNMTLSTISYSKANFKIGVSTPIYSSMSNISFWLLLVCCLGLPFRAASVNCAGPEVFVNAKMIALTGTYFNHSAKLIYRHVANQITDSCDGDLTFVSDKVLMERVLDTDPLIPTAPRTLIPNGRTTGLIGNAGLLDGSGNALVDGLTFHCYEYRQDIRVWAKNDAGNWRFGVATITIQDIEGFCVDPVLAYGIIGTENGSPVKDVVATASRNDTTVRSSTTSASGTFNLGFYGFDSLLYKLSMTKTIDTDKKNGVTTLDLALIFKHLLGEQLLNSPYKIIAADVNQDGEVDALDMLIIRRFLLNITPTLPRGTWRFIDKNYAFRDPNNPLAESFPEFIKFINFIPHRSTNFIGVKLGDVNNSFDGTVVRSTRTLTLNTPNIDIVGGHEYTIAISADKLNAAAFQGTFAFEGATVKAVKAGNLNNTSEANFGQFNKAVTVSWNGRSEAAAEVVSITFKAAKSGKLSDILTLNSAVTLSEAYDSAGNVLNLKLQFDSGKNANNAFALYQNTPNPVDMSTIIGFNLSKDGQATLTIYTADGKMLRSVNNSYKKGYNEIRVNKSDLNASGILYYRLDTQEGSSTRKMIVIE